MRWWCTAEVLVDDRLYCGGGRLGVGRVGGYEREAVAVGAGRRERESCDFPQEAVGNLEEDAGAVAGVDLGTRGAAMVEVAEGSEGGGDDVAACPTQDVGDERDPARVVLKPGVIEPMRSQAAC